MNVVFVARHIAIGPLAEDSADKASNKECGLRRLSLLGDDWLVFEARRGSLTFSRPVLPWRPRGGDRLDIGSSTGGGRCEVIGFLVRRVWIVQITILCV